MEEYRDNNNDGVVDVKYTNTLDANGHVIEQATDVNNDGVVDKVERYTLDAQGRPEFIYVDNGANNVVERIEGITRDANGHIIQRNYYIGDTITATPNAVRYYEVDANGALVKMSEDRDNNGTIDSISSYERDIYGNVLKQENDTNADGTIDSITYNEYDSLGRLSYQWNDRNVDGIKNSPDNEGLLYEYDERGNLIHSKGYDHSTGRTAETFRTYNDLDQMIQIEYDHNSTNAPGIDETYKYEYDAIFGNRSKEYYILASGKVGIVTTYEIDNTGNIALSLRDRVNKATGADLSPDGFVDQIALGGDINAGGAYSSSVDLISWLNEPNRATLFDGSLRRISLSNSTAESTLTLNKETLKAFADKTLLINGDATDTINFKDAESEFTKLTTQRATNAGNGNQLYDQYTTQIDGETYTIQIDADINVNFGA